MSSVACSGMSVAHSAMASFVVAACVSACSGSDDSQAPSTPQASFSDAAQESTAFSDEASTETPEVANANDDNADSSPPLFSQLDVTRIHAGLERVVGISVADLNRKLFSGVSLTEREQACTGSFEPANGQPLFGIDCPEVSYRTAQIPITITRAGFFDTQACAAGLLEGEYSNCRLGNADLAIETIFEVPDRPDDDDDDGFTPQRPVPVQGAVITFDVTVPATMTLADNDAGLSSGFECTFRASGEGVISSSGALRCADEARRIADRLETLVPVL